MIDVNVQDPRKMFFASYLVTVPHSKNPVKHGVGAWETSWHGSAWQITKNTRKEYPKQSKTKQPLSNSSSKKSNTIQEIQSSTILDKPTSTSKKSSNRLPICLILPSFLDPGASQRHCPIGAHLAKQIYFGCQIAGACAHKTWTKMVRNVTRTLGCEIVDTTAGVTCSEAFSVTAVTHVT